MKLTLQLVTWNGARYIAPLFASLKRCRLSGVICQLFVLDNGSTDGTVEALKKELATLPFPHQLVELKENTGFACGHNRLFLKAKEAQYVLIFNQDMEFESDCIGKLLQFLETHPEAAAVAPRLMRLLPDNGQGSTDYGLETDLIDSLGLKKYRTWRVADLGSGQPWSQKSTVHSPSVRVFGVSGACVMFRMSALRTVAFPDSTIFDELYGSYKEDVDLAFRMKRKGLRSFVLLDAVAYHARGSADGKEGQSFSIRYQSYRNHLATIFKNFSTHRILDVPFVLWYEAWKFLWYLIFDRKVLGGWRDLWKMRKKLYERRQHCLR